VDGARRVHEEDLAAVLFGDRVEANQEEARLLHEIVGRGSTCLTASRALLALPLAIALFVAREATAILAAMRRSRTRRRGRTRRTRGRRPRRFSPRRSGFHPLNLWLSGGEFKGTAPAIGRLGSRFVVAAEVK
jgi:hypothetical protein